MAEYQGLKMISNINITIANLIREKYHHQAMAEYRGRRGEDLALNHFVNSIVVEEQVLIIMIKIAIYCPKGSGTLRQQLLRMH